MTAIALIITAIILWGLLLLAYYDATGKWSK